MKNGVFLRVLFIVSILLTFVIVNNVYVPHIVAKKNIPIDNNIDLDSVDSFIEVYSRIKELYVDNVSDSQLMQNAMKGMVSELDPHSAYLTKQDYINTTDSLKGQFGGIGIQIGIKEGVLMVISPIDDTPASRAGVKAGDIIYKIGDSSTAGMTIDEAVSLMRGKPGTKVTVTFLRTGLDKPLILTLKREIIKSSSLQDRILDGDIGYIRISSFNLGLVNDVKKVLKDFSSKGVKGYIIDLRSNPGGSLEEVENMVSLFLPNNSKIVLIKSKEGEFERNTTSQGFLDKSKPMVVIVDEGSASASEIFAGAMQDHKRGVVIGKTTFGKASVQRMLELSDGSALKLTIARYYTPNNRSIQGVGIVPDIIVERGVISYDETPSFIVQEKDLARHLVGENEKNESSKSQEDVAKDRFIDLQLQTAVTMLKGLILNEK